MVQHVWGIRPQMPQNAHEIMAILMAIHALCILTARDKQSPTYFDGQYFCNGKSHGRSEPFINVNYKSH